MVLKLSNVILDALSTKDELTLNELYEIIGDNSDFVWEPSVRKHRVRSALYNLQQYNKIERSSAATYKKL
jgi:hypothetical protein